MTYPVSGPIPAGAGYGGEHPRFYDADPDERFYVMIDGEYCVVEDVELPDPETEETFPPDREAE